MHFRPGWVAPCALVCTLVAGAAPTAQADGLREPSRDQRLELIRGARVWEPVDIATRDLWNGPPGKLDFAVGQEVACEFVPKYMSGGTSKFACRLGDGEEVKVKYEKDGKYKEVFGEVLGTRLFWALGFYADRMLPVSVTCRGCPADPFEFVGSHAQQVPMDSEGNIRAIPPSADIGTHRFELAVIEDRLPGKNLETRDHEGWSWDMLDTVDPAAGGATRAELDAFRLLQAFVQNADNKSKQNKLVCPPDAVRRSDGGRLDCAHPVLYVSDLGSVFGNGGFTTGGSGRVDYQGWKERRVWKDERQCQARLAAIGGVFLGSTLRDPVIGEEGRALLARLLDQLSDAQIADLFRVSRIEQLQQKMADGSGGEREVRIEDWVQLFKEKRRQITAHPGCGSAPASAQQTQPFPPSVPATFGPATELFDPVGFHEVRFEIEPAAWKGYLKQAGKRGGGENYVAATIAIDGTGFGTVGIRPFGYGSRSYNPGKPNIRIDFAHLRREQRGPEGVLVLRLKGSGQDRTFLRQPLSQAAVQAAGGYAPRYSWARVSVNGRSHGLYQVFEHVDERLFAHRFGNDDGDRYEIEKNCFGLSCPESGCNELASRYRAAGGAGGAREIVRLAQTAQRGDAGWFEEATRIADMPALLAQYAVEVWASDVDGIAAAGQNFSVYVNRRGGLLEFIPTGMDKGFGTYRNDAWYTIEQPWGPPNRWCKGRVDEFYRKLWNTENAQRALLEKLRFLHCGPLSDATLLPLIDAYRALLHEDVYRDPTGKASKAELDTAYAQLEDYVRRRNAYLDEAIGRCD